MQMSQHIGGAANQPQTCQAITNLRHQLEGIGREKVSVPIGAFVRAKTPEHLLALAGLHSRFKGEWDRFLTLLAQDHYLSEAQRPELPAPQERLIADIRIELRNLSSGRFGQAVRDAV